VAVLLRDDAASQREGWIEVHFDSLLAITRGDENGDVFRGELWRPLGQVVQITVGKLARTWKFLGELVEVRSLTGVERLGGLARTWEFLGQLVKVMKRITDGAEA